MLHTPTRSLLKGSTCIVRPTNDEIAKLPRHYVGDQMFTLDAQLAAAGFSGVTTDSTGVFLLSQLERYDRTLNEPLYNVTWSRDVQLRTDVSLGDELASWNQVNYGTAGGLNPTGKNWISSNTNAIPGPSVDMGKLSNPLYPWGMELGWTVFELAKAERTGVPVDQAKYDAMRVKWDMDVDENVYIGEALFAQYGLWNSPLITATNAVNGASASPLWSSKTPQEMLNDVNAVLNAAWTASGYAVMPDQLRLPPTQFLLLNATIVTSAGSTSILKFLQENNASVAINGRPLNIQPSKWLVAAARGAGSDRMVAYTNEPRFVRFPMVPLSRTPLELRSIYQLTTYYGKLGFVEWRYAETARYLDGI